MQRTKCEIWARIMGYFRPISSANIGKQQEYKDRLFFKSELDQKESEEDVKNKGESKGEGWGI